MFGRLPVLDAWKNLVALRILDVKYQIFSTEVSSEMNSALANLFERHSKRVWMMNYFSLLHLGQPMEN